MEAVTFNIWDGIEAKELEDQINARINMDLEPPVITKATLEVSQVLETINLANPPSTRSRII